MDGMNWLTIFSAVAVLAAAAPYVLWVKHPRQRPFAAYLVFVTVFALACVMLFLLLGWLASSLGLAAALGRWGLGVLLVLLGVVPALVIATWQARQPPSNDRPPR
jgi:uncharacterized membrane protein required for colicin V production